MLLLIPLEQKLFDYSGPELRIQKLVYKVYSEPDFWAIQLAATDFENAYEFVWIDSS